MIGKPFALFLQDTVPHAAWFREAKLDETKLSALIPVGTRTDFFKVHTPKHGRC